MKTEKLAYFIQRGSQCLQACDVQYGLQKSCNYSLTHVNQAKPLKSTSIPLGLTSIWKAHVRLGLPSALILSDFPTKFCNRKNISVTIMCKLREACKRNRGLIHERHNKLFLSNIFKTSLRTNQPPIQSISRAISKGLKRTECQPGHCPSSSTDFHNEWKNASSFYAPSWRVRGKICLLCVDYMHYLDTCCMFFSSLPPSLIQSSQQYLVTNCTN